MAKLCAKGVLIGGLVDVVASVVLGIPVAFYALSRLDLTTIPKSQIESVMVMGIYGNRLLYATQLLLGLACSVLGGYVAARLANHDEMFNGTLSSFLCIALGAYTVVSGTISSPLLIQTLAFVLSPASGLLGGYLRALRKRSHRLAA